MPIIIAFNAATELNKVCSRHGTHVTTSELQQVARNNKFACFAQPSDASHANGVTSPNRDIAIRRLITKINDTRRKFSFQTLILLFDVTMITKTALYESFFILLKLVNFIKRKHLIQILIQINNCLISIEIYGYRISNLFYITL